MAAWLFTSWSISSWLLPAETASPIACRFLMASSRSGVASFWLSSRTVLTSFFWSLLSLRVSVRRVSLSGWVPIGIRGPVDAPLPPPPPRWAKARVAARMPASNNLKNMRDPLIPSSSSSGAAGGRIEHSGHQLECRRGLALLIGFERRTDFGEGLGLNAGHLGGHGGIGIRELLEIVRGGAAEHRLGNLQLSLHHLLAQRRGFFQGVGDNREGFGLLVLVELEVVGEDIEGGLALNARHGARVVSHPASASEI